MADFPTLPETSGASRAARLAELSPEKRRLLEQRMRARAAVGTPEGVIPRRDQSLPPVVSHAQLGLLLLDEVQDDLVAYNVATAVRIAGALNVAALRAAFDDLVARHDVLRSRLTVRDGAGHLEFAEPHPCDMRIQAVTDVDAYVKAAVTEPFDLASGHLLRAHLGVIGTDAHVLVIVTHHIASDAVSKGVLARELNALYVAHRDGASSGLAPIDFDYADYAAWQTARLDAAADLEWWRSTLTGAPEQTDLPFDRARGPQADFAGAKHARRIDAGLVAEIGAFARQQRASVFMVLLAAYAGLLERYRPQGDIVIASPTSGRHHEQLRDVVGFFINLLPLRIDTSGDPTFIELVTRARKAATDSYKHQDVPFDKIVEAVRPSRAAGRSPLVQTQFTLKEGLDSVPVLDGLQVVALPFEGGWTKLDLSVICHRSGADLTVLWQYATALFDAPTIERLAAHFEALLRAGVAQPGRPLSALTLSGPEDVAAINAANDTGARIASGLLHELVAERARRAPDALAVGDDTGWITFRELDERSDRLAHHLVALGVLPDSQVAIMVERSIALEVALLAVLKAGGAYVPLDPGYPRDRLEFMLADSGAVALVTTGDLVAKVSVHEKTVLLDEVDLSRYPTGIPQVGVTPANLAYVIYTSGTTGRPKGVQIEHRNIVNQLQWMVEQLGVSDTDTILQKTPISFDLSGWEVLLAPFCGARLFMARPGGHLDPDYLIETVVREGITLLNFVPSMLGVFIAREQVTRCTSVRFLIAIGEALPDDVKDRCLQVLPGAQLWNLYGPTETAIGITGERCRPDATVSIGRPMYNSSALVLDASYGHQPVGMPGELYLGGAQCARGYSNRPELTGERFVQTPHGRVYRTGDRAVWQPDGRLQFLGRLDDQVKLRGFRIELGEIEAVMTDHVGVQAACATLGTTSGGLPALLGFVSPRPDVENRALAATVGVSTAQLERWREIWERTFLEADAADPTFDTRGRVDLLTGRPVNEPDMREWVRASVERIAALRPETVLEVGVGSGLLLWRLAPRVTHYDAIDFSHAAIARLAVDAHHNPNATFRVQAAHELSPVESTRRYDCVVLDSVVQYFPDETYLRTVLERALGVLAPGGCVFLGDVRDLRLQDALALELAHTHAPASSVAELRAALDDRRLSEEELLVAPGWFEGLPGVTHVQVMPRRGRAATEMNRFRYDVILHTASLVEHEIDDWLPWSGLGSVEGMEQQVSERDGRSFGLTGVPNRRVAGPLFCRRELADGRLAPPTGDDSGIDPDDLIELGAAAGYRVEVSTARDPGLLDVAFVESAAPAVFPKAAADPEPLCNDPASSRVRARFRDVLVTELMAAMRLRLPDYMVPASVRVLESLPTTPSGKLDRRSLAELTLQVRSRDRIEPRTPTERHLSRLWASALGIDAPISVDDSFFDLGGSSLLALTLFPRIEREFRVKLTLSMLFDNVTVETLAATIDAQRSGESTGDRVVTMRRSGYKRPLFLMPEQRGDVLAYRQMVNAMDQDRPVYGVECVGLDGRELPRFTIEEVAEDCITAMKRIQPSGPYLVAGYCFGGVVAYQVAALLVDRGEGVDFVGVIDGTPFGRGGWLTPAPPPPSLPQRFLWRNRLELTRKIFIVRDWWRGARNLAVAKLCARLGSRIPRPFVDVKAANDYAGKRYRTPDAAVAVTYFRASRGSAEADEARRKRWELVAEKGAEMHVVSGYYMNHKQIVRSAYAPRLAVALDEVLNSIE